MTTISQGTDKPSSTEILRYAEAAAFLNMPVGSVYALVHWKRIPHFRVSTRTVLFRKADLEAWLLAHAVREEVQAAR